MDNAKILAILQRLKTLDCKRRRNTFLWFVLMGFVDAFPPTIELKAAGFEICVKGDWAEFTIGMFEAHGEYTYYHRDSRDPHSYTEHRANYAMIDLFNQVVFIELLDVAA